MRIARMHGGLSTSKRSWQSTRPDWFSRLGTPSRIKLLLAIFFTFAPTSVLMISRFEEKRSGAALAAYAILGGFTAVGWAFSFMRTKWFLAVLLPSQLLWFVLPAYFFRADFRSGFTFSIEGSACILLIVAGYVLFVIFIAGEGVKSIRMETELSLAREIHAGLVPPVDLCTPRLELYGRSIASSEMGGDLIDVVERDGAVGVFIADVSGHGVKAGVVMGMVKAAIRMKLQGAASLDAVLADLNHVLADVTAPEMFVTAACLRFDAVPGIQFGGAGHGPVLRYVKATGTVERVESEHLPLGVSPHEAYTARRLSAEPGDVFLLMTDGLFETFDPTGRAFSQEPIERMLATYGTDPLADVYERIMGAVTRFGPRTDDQTLLLARILG